MLVFPKNIPFPVYKNCPTCPTCLTCLTCLTP